MSERASGMWMHISCLPSGQWIGCFDENAIEFIDFLSESRVKYWQICPLGPLTYGDSPYQCVSSFALNPYFINLKKLVEDDLLTQQKLLGFKRNFTENCANVDYGKLYNLFLPILNLAADRFVKSKEYFAWLLTYTQQKKYSFHYLLPNYLHHVFWH